MVEDSVFYQCDICRSLLRTGAGCVKGTWIGRDTLVIFFSDHGDLMGERGNAHTKYCMYDSAVRVPLVVRCPRLNQGQVLDAPVELVDLMPTWLEAAGLEVPETMPGRSLYPLLGGNIPENWRTATFSEMYTIPGESRAQWIMRTRKCPECIVRSGNRPQ